MSEKSSVSDLEAVWKSGGAFSHIFLLYTFFFCISVFHSWAVSVLVRNHICSFSIISKKNNDQTIIRLYFIIRIKI